MSSPRSRRQKYSPCSFALVCVALPLGAYFQTKSAIANRVRPVNETSARLPAKSSCVASRMTGSDLQVRQARAPAVARAHVAAGVRVDRSGAHAVAVALAARKAVAIADLGAQLEELFRGCNPFDLQSILHKLASDEGLVGKRRIDEVPDVLVLLVEVADAGEEASEFRHDAFGQRWHEAVGFLHRHRVLGRERNDEVAGELVVDVGADRDLRLAQSEAAPAGRHLVGLLESAECVLLRVPRQVRVGSLQHHRYRGIECGNATCG